MINMIELIKELRSRTHLGMTECKKALEEFEGDIEKAIEALQKRGLKKVDDFILPTEGMVQASILNDLGHIVEINCQTDFGARSEIFQEFVKQYVNDSSIGSEDLKAKLTLTSNQLGEKIVIRRSSLFLPTQDSIFTVYNHLGGKIAVLMESAIKSQNSELPNRVILNFLDNITMQIAATKPLSVDRESLSTDLVQKKIAFYEEEVKFRPADIRRKILDGKMNKWYSEVVLLEQDAVFVPQEESRSTIRQEIDKLGLNGLVSIKRFVRYERGEVV